MAKDWPLSLPQFRAPKRSSSSINASAPKDTITKKLVAYMLLAEYSATHWTSWRFHENTRQRPPALIFHGNIFFGGYALVVLVLFTMSCLPISHDAPLEIPSSSFLKMVFDPTYHGPRNNGEGRPRDVISELRDDELRTSSNRTWTRSHILSGLTQM